MKLLTRAAGKDAKVVLVPSDRESVPTVRFALLCNAAPAEWLHRSTTTEATSFVGTRRVHGIRHRSPPTRYMRKSECKSGTFSKTAARPGPDLE
jgi:hypothetical protein